VDYNAVADHSFSKNYVKRWRTVRWRRYWRAYVSITHALIGNVGDGNFRPSFFIKSNISALDRLIVMKFHTNIANR